MTQKHTDEAPAFKGGKKPGPKESPVQVRDAGNDATADKSKTWDKEDDIIDESFPASDPPSNY